MAHLTGIGIENFRVFKDYTEFDFAPITILTGANNSGKSSLFKALLLLKDSFTGERLEELDFTKVSHKAGDMNNVLNNKEKPLIFYFPFPIEFYTIYDLVIGFEFSTDKPTGKKFKAALQKITIWDKTHTSNKQDFTKLFETSLTDETVFIDLVKWKEMFRHIDEHINRAETEKRLRYAKIVEKKVEKEQQRQENLDKKIEEYLSSKGKSWSDYKDDQVKDDENTNHAGLIFNLNFPKTAKEKILAEMLKEGEISDYDYHGDDNDEIKIDDSPNDRYKAWQHDFYNKDREVNLFKIDNLVKPKIDYQHLFEWNDEDLRELHKKDYRKERLDFEQENPDDDPNRYFWELQDNESLDVYHIANKYHPDLKKNQITILSELLNVIEKDLFLAIQGFTKFLSNLIAIRGTNERVYKDSSILGNILQQGGNFEGEQRKKFVDYWLKEFNIKGFDTVNMDNSPDLEVSKISLHKRKNKEEKRDLIDLGFGTQQLLTILLKISYEGIKDQSQEEMKEHTNVHMYTPKTLLIEEPEANLHPKYQSLLADMLIDAADKFNIQFIIETHSEYLIRKLQYWVAKGTIKPTDVALYYLNDPESENVKNGKAKQVERIEIKEDGSIEENYEKYWSGFFDEALNSEILLWSTQLLRKTFKEQEIKVLYENIEQKREIENLKEQINKYGKERGSEIWIEKIEKQFEEIKQENRKEHEETRNLIKTVQNGLNDFYSQFNEFKKTQSNHLELILDLMIDSNKENINIYYEEVGKWLVDWDKLDGKSMLYLASAEFLYNNMKGANQEDFSPIIIQYSRAIENELIETIFKDFRTKIKEIKYKTSTKYELIKSETKHKIDSSDIFKNKQESLALLQCLDDRLMLGGMIHSFDTLLLVKENNFSIRLFVDFEEFINNKSDCEKILKDTFLNSIKRVKDKRNDASHTYKEPINDIRIVNNFIKDIKKTLQVWVEAKKQP